MIEELGTDGLRLWVSSIDASGEASCIKNFDDKCQRSV